MRATGAALCALMFALWAPGAQADGPWDIPKDPSKFHILLFMGQSNMAGGFRDSHLYDDNGRHDPVTAPVPRVVQWRSGGWRPAAHPLTKHNKLSFSIPLPFAQKYLEEIGDPEVKVGLVVRAFGGKAIDHFVRGGRFYPSPRMLQALKKQGTFKGVIWHQGEADTLRIHRFVTYERKLHWLIADVRKSLDMPNLPFVTGQLALKSSNEEPKKEYWSEALGVVCRVLANVGDRIPYAAHARSSGAPVVREHVRHLVDENGVPTGKTMRIRNNLVHFNRAGYTIMAHRYVDAILDRPLFKNDPVRIFAVPGRPFSTSLVKEVCDLSRDKLTFSWKGAPDWVRITRDGKISGTPPALGTTTFTISVTDRSRALDTVKMEIVAKKAEPPAFSAEVFDSRVRRPAIAGKEYRDRARFDRVRAWSSELYEPNGDPVTFSKVSGPQWLKVAPDGAFSGTPAPEDASKTVTFTVKAADADGSDTATYKLDVLGPQTVWIERFDYYPDIEHEAVGPLLHFGPDSPRDTWFIPYGSFPVDKPKDYTDLCTSLFGQWFKFARGTLCARAIVLDAKRFSGSKGRYRFRFNLFGVSPDDAHFFVSIYAVKTGPTKDDQLTVELENKSAATRGKPASVVAKGCASVAKLAEKDFTSADGKGFKDLFFDYGGTGDVMVVFSASRSTAGAGGGSRFDNLSITALTDAAQ